MMYDKYADLDLVLIDDYLAGRLTPEQEETVAHMFADDAEFRENLRLDTVLSKLGNDLANAFPDDIAAIASARAAQAAVPVEADPAESAESDEPRLSDKDLAPIMDAFRQRIGLLPLPAERIHDRRE